MKELAKKLEDKKKEEEKIKIDVGKMKSAWLDQLNSFLAEVERWLSPLVEEKLVSLRKKEIDIREELLGRYNAPSLEIQGSSWTIILEPIGRHIIGAMGRVDILYGPKRIMIVLRDDGWKLAKKMDRGFEYKPFNEELFAEIIEELMI